VVSARLALANGGLVGPIDSHVVVIGLGDLGTRVLASLDDLGIGVVAIDRDPEARGVEVARQRHIPVIVGDATRRETLAAASVHTSRSLVVLTSSDLANVQTSLLARRASPYIRAVMRLFDSEFAERIGRTFGFITSRSVSALAAPSFAAAILGHEVVATIPVRRRVLLAAEVPVGAGSQLDGQIVGDLQREGEIRIIAIRTGRGTQVLWAPPAGRRLARTDTLVAITNRSGLGDLLRRSVTADAHRTVTTYDSMPLRHRP
jgi:Trk K+ transport system NAD-binding subunit